MRSLRSPLLTGLALCGLLAPAALSLALPVRGDDGDTPPTQPATPPTTTDTAPATSSVDPAVRAVTEAIRAGDYATASKLIKEKPAASIAPSDARRWQLLSALVAMRTGDRKWLDSITTAPDYTASSEDLMIVVAGRLLQDGRYDRARAVLQSIPEPDIEKDIPHRRYLEVWTRLEQLTNHPAEERKYAERLIDFTGRWSSEECQTCHANPRRYGKDVTTLNVSTLWFGNRYTDLLRQQGDAAKVAADAAKDLAKDPTDSSARLRLAYAQRALGQDAKATETLHGLTWAEFPEREKKAPLRLANYP